MSSIDERVVKMEFDNAKFESGVKDSLNTIENLKVSLDKLDSTKISFDQIQRAAQNLNLENIASGIDKITDRFSTMGIVGGTAIAKITNGVMDFVTKGVSSLTAGVRQTWSTITTGGMQRAQNIENAKFQIEGLGRTWEEVSGSIDEAVNDTAYGLDEAALAASQFLATGVETGDKMTTALRSISGVAAMTNSGYSEIANIMTTIAGNGKVMTMQLNQLGAKGINAAATIRDYFNSSTENLDKFTKLYNDTKKKNQASIAPGVKATEQDIRQMVTNGAIDFELFSAAMDSAYGEHAKDAQRTFEGSSKNVQAALKRLGAEFKSVTISSEDYDKTLDSNKKADFTKKTFNQINVLNELRNVIKGIHTDMKSAGFVTLFSDIYHAMSRGMAFFLNGLYITENGTTKLIPQLSESLVNLKAAVENIAGFVIGIASAFSSAWKAVFPQSLADTILSITQHIKEFTDMLPRVDDLFGGISEIFGIFDDTTDDIDNTVESVENLEEAYDGVTGSLRELVRQTINGDFGNGAERIDKLGDSYQEIQDAVNSCYDDQWRLHEDWINNIDETLTVGAKLAATEEDIAQKQTEAANVAEKTEQVYNGMMTTLEETVPVVAKYGGSFEGLKGILMGVFSAVNLVKFVIVNAVLIIRKFVLPVIFRIGEVLLEIAGTIGSFISALASLLPTTRQTGEALDFLAGVLQPLWDLFHFLTQGVIDFMRAIRPENDPLGKLGDYISGFITSSDGLTQKMSDVLENVKTFALGIVERVGDIQLPNGRKISEVFSEVFAPVAQTVESIVDKIKNIKFPDGSTLQKKLEKAFSGVPQRFAKIRDRIVENASGIFSFLGSMRERINDSIHMDGASVGDRIEYAFDPLLSVLSKVKDKLSETFKPILEFLSPITTAISSLMGKIVEGLKLMAGAIFDKISNLPDMAKSLKQKFEPILSYLRPLADTVKDVLSKIVEMFGSFINDLANSIDFSKNPFQILHDMIMTFGSGVANAFREIANSQIVASIKDFATMVIGGIRDAASALAEGIQTAFKPMFDSISSIFSPTKAYADELGESTNDFSKIGSDLEKANDSISGPAQAFADTIRKLGTTLVIFLPTITQSILSALTIWNVGVKLPRALTRFLDGMTGMFDGVAGLLGQLTTSLKNFTRAVDFNLLTDGLKSLAIGLAVITGVILVFGMTDWSVIQQGLVALSIVALGLLGITAILMAISTIGNFTDFGKGLLTMAGGVLLFVVALGALMWMLGAKTETVNGETKTVYTNLINIAVALGVMVVAMTAILAPIVGAMVIAKKIGTSFKDVGRAFMHIGVGLALIVHSIAAMQRMLDQVIKEGNWESFLGAIGLIVLLTAALVAAQIFMSKFDTESTEVGKGLIQIAVAMAILSAAIGILTSVDMDKAYSAFDVLFAMLIGIAGIIIVVSKMQADMESIGIGLRNIAMAMLMLTGALVIIAMMGDTVWPAIGALGILVTLITLLAFVCGQSSASLKDGGVGMLMMAGAVAILAGSLFILSTYADSSKLMNSAGALLVVTLGLTALAAVCAFAKSKMTVGAAAILVISVAIGVLAASLIAVVNLTKGGDLMGAAIAIGILLAALLLLGVAAKILPEGFAILSAACLSLAAVIGVVALAMLGGALAFSMILEAIAKFSQTDADLFSIAGGVALLGIALIALAAGAAILGIAMIAFGAGAIVAAVGVGALAVSLLMVVGVIAIAVALFQAAGNAIMNGLLGGILSGIGGVLGAIGSVASGLIGGFCSILGIHSPSTVFQMFGKFITEGLKGGLGDGADIGQMFGSMVGDGAFEGLTSSFGDFDLTSMVGDFDLDSLGGMFDSVGGDWMSSLGLGMSKSEEPVEVSSEKVEEAAAKANEQTELFKPVGENAMKMFTQGMKEFDASSFYNGLGGESGLAAQMSAAINDIQFNSSAFYAAGEQAMQAFIEGVDTSIETVRDRISTLISTAANAASIKDLTPIGKQMGVQFVTGLNSQIDEARAAGLSLAANAHDGASSGDLWWTGYWMAVGFVNGIRSQVESARSAGYDLGKASKEGAQQALNENSPSKEMYKVGSYAGEGLVLGMQGKIKDVRSAGGALGDAVLTAMEMLPSFFDADPNLQPTITPVLDMSNVEAGLYAMSNNPMFGFVPNDSYFTIAAQANNTSAAMAAGNVNYQIHVDLNWEAGQDANDAAEAIAFAIEERLRMEG